MPQFRLARPVVLLAVTGLLAACSHTAGSGAAASGAAAQTGLQPAVPTPAQSETAAQKAAQKTGSPHMTSIFTLFNGGPNPNTTIAVNKYIWQAALQVLDFLPIESVDPFSGVIVTGYGVPPGGGQAFRATIYVQDPALDARSLHVALQTRGGVAVPAATERAVEDAILSRARQLRIADAKL